MGSSGGGERLPDNNEPLTAGSNRVAILGRMHMENTGRAGERGDTHSMLRRCVPGGGRSGGGTAATSRERGTVEYRRTQGWSMGRTCLGNQQGVELLNTWNVVQEFKETWSGESVQMCSDNVEAVFIMGRSCMRNSCLHALSLRIWQLAWQRGISPCAQ
jgi:hypothetical protein